MGDAQQSFYELNQLARHYGIRGAINGYLPLAKVSPADSDQLVRDIREGKPIQVPSPIRVSHYGAAKADFGTTITSLGLSTIT
jgi:hypothetical protein